jgi:hypothetical protein
LACDSHLVSISWTSVSAENFFDIFSPANFGQISTQNQQMSSVDNNLWNLSIL